MFVMLNGNIFTLQGLEPRLNMPNVHYSQLKIFFTVTWNPLGTSTLTSYRCLSQLLFLKKCSTDLRPEAFKNANFLYIIYSKSLWGTENKKKFLRWFWHLKVWFVIPRVLKFTICAEIFFKLLQLLPKNQLRTPWRMIRMRKYLAKFIRMSRIMSFTKRLVYNWVVP